MNTDQVLERGAEGWWLRGVRRLWPAVAGMVVVLSLASLPGYLNEFDFFQIAPEPTMLDRLLAEIGRLLSLLCTVVSISLAALVYWRRPDERMALYTSYFLLFYGIALGGPLELLASYYLGSLDLAYILQTVFFGLPMMLFIMVFPNGRFTPRWPIWVAGFWMLALSFYGITTYVADVPREVADLAFSANIGLPVMLAMIIVFTQIVRYRKYYTQVERQQTKWAVLGIILFLCLLALSSIPYVQMTSLPPGASQPAWAPAGSMLWWLGISMIPVFFTIAILRSRLWDIDVVIRRTLVYSSITAVLALIYFGGVTVIQALFTSLIGQGSPLAVVASTLAIAALFTPLRRRVQDVIDRRFYRRKYDAARTVEAFVAAVRDEVDMDQLSERLLAVVEETMQPEHVSLWLCPAEIGQSGKSSQLSEMGNG